MDPYGINFLQKVNYVRKHGRKFYNSRWWKALREDFRRRQDLGYFGDWDKYTGPRNRSSAIMGSNYTAVGPDAGAGMDLGPASNDRVFKCTRVLGRKKKLKLQRVINGLLTRMVWKYQSLVASTGGQLGTGYRVGGSIPLMNRLSTASYDVYPREVDLAVYVIRLSSPTGYQTFADGSHFMVAPQMMYRLRAKQNVAEEEWMYFWIPVDPTYNADSDTPTLNAPAMEFLEAYPDKTEIFWEGCDARVMFTAPTTTAADCEVRVVEFTDHQYAPADAGYKVPDNTLVTLAENGGALGLPDMSLNRIATAFYSNWLHNKNSHPILRDRMRVNVRGPPPFRTLQKWSTTLNARNTTNADTGPIQHIHEQKIYANRWFKTGQPDMKNNGPSMGPLSIVYDKEPDYESENAGIFPNPKHQKWLMINGFVRGSIPSAIGTPNINPAIEPSFDVHIVSRFKFVRD